jgi:hypothetical protein
MLHVWAAAIHLHGNAENPGHLVSHRAVTLVM